MKLAICILIVALAAAQASNLKLSFKDCGDSSTHAVVKDVEPQSVATGASTTVTGSGTLDEDVDSATFTMSMTGLFGVKLLDCQGDGAVSQTCAIKLAGVELGSLAFSGITFPIKKGDVTGVPKIDITLSSTIPSAASKTTTTLHVNSKSGDKIICVEIMTAAGTTEEAMRPADSVSINNKDHIAYLNTQNSTWVAGENARFEGMSYNDARGLLGTQLSHISEHLDSVRNQSLYDEVMVIPDSFDATAEWAGLLHPIRDQEQCGSCWAFSASEVLSDRFAIASKVKSPVLSPEDLLQCDKGDMGCSGGRLASAWSYLKSTGIVTDTCSPYTSGKGTDGQCTQKCADSETWKPYKAHSTFAINGVENMQKEIMTNGPIQVAFTVYKSFMSYKTGVYQKHWYEFLPEGGHAVKIVGWGTENGVDYWKVANSWNTSWGEDGYFRILRGEDQCGIEKSGPPYAGTPAL